jgi:hypothetical protein
MVARTDLHAALSRAVRGIELKRNPNTWREGEDFNTKHIHENHFTSVFTIQQDMDPSPPRALALNAIRQ